jgi:drug/metabolite transporter (DMT)-like permease
MNSWKWTALILIAIISLIVEFWMHHEPHGWWSSIPAFWIIFGLLGCIGLIFFAKTLGKLLVNRKEDYYDAE